MTLLCPCARALDNNKVLAACESDEQYLANVLLEQSSGTTWVRIPGILHLSGGRRADVNRSGICQVVPRNGPQPSEAALDIGEHFSSSAAASQNAAVDLEVVGDLSVGSTRGRTGDARTRRRPPSAVAEQSRPGRYALCDADALGRHPVAERRRSSAFAPAHVAGSALHHRWTPSLQHCARRQGLSGARRFRH